MTTDMTELTRPAFVEGRVLAAADLTAVVEHGRGQAARHNRHLHDWGIAAGLELTRSTRPDPLDATVTVVAVTVASGLAIDGTGRELVLTSPAALSKDLFLQVNGQSLAPGAWFPVLLRGFDEAPVDGGTGGILSGCGGAGGTGGQPRVTETVEITFGAPRSAKLLADQEPPDVAAGPGPYEKPPPWDVLLGYVSWDAQKNEFAEVSYAPPDLPPRRYAGVRADTVAARGGRLELRPEPVPSAGNVVLTVGGDPDALVFGRYTGSGGIEALLTVSAEGNVQARGQIAGALATGETRAQSGSAGDGTRLPLPPGVSEEDVAAGKVLVHVQVTPRLSAGLARYERIGPFVQECRVDAARRVHCLLAWYPPGSAIPELAPGAVDYLVLAGMTALAGGGS